MGAPNIQDYATSLVTVAPSPQISGSEIQVTTGEAARFGPVPFAASIHPADQLPTLDNAERVVVGGKVGDTLIISRGVSPTTAKSIAVGWRISNAIFASDVANAYDRSNHSGSQPSSSISDFATAVDARFALRRYTLNDKDLTSSTSYFYYGYADVSGNYRIKRYNRTTLLPQYASGAAPYATAWAGRAALTYV